MKKLLNITPFHTKRFSKNGSFKTFYFKAFIFFSWYILHYYRLKRSVIKTASRYYDHTSIQCATEKHQPHLNCPFFFSYKKVKNQFNFCLLPFLTVKQKYPSRRCATENQLTVEGCSAIVKRKDHIVQLVQVSY